jgi:hypothetical protein
MILIKIRFNTENKGCLFWRVLIDDTEYLAENINIKVPVNTSQDVLKDGRTKHHISCFCNQINWDKNNLIIS